MVIRFTAIDSQGKCRRCSWWVTNLDFGLDALGIVVAKGSQPGKVELIDPPRS